MKVLIFIILLTSFVNAEIDSDTATLCRNISKLSALANETVPRYQIAVSPAPPYTGVVFGLTQRTNVIVELCEFVNNFQQMEGLSKINYSKDYLNQLTGQKWDQHFDFYDDSFNYASSIYDFQTGKQNKGVIGSAGFNRDTNEYIKTTQSYRKSLNSQDADYELSMRRTQEVDQISKIIEKRAALDQATSCPDKSSEPDYTKIYKDKIYPQQKAKQDADEELAYFKEQLLKIGPKFLNNSAELSQYIADVDRLDGLGIGLETKLSKKTEDTFIPSKTRKNKDGTPKLEKKTRTREIQVYSAKLYDQIFSDFSQKYRDQWQKWIRITYLTKTTEYGLYGAQDRIESELRDLSYECRENFLMRNFSTDKSNYESEYERRRKQCYESVSLDGKEAENLLQFYTNQYRDALYRSERAIAVIWTIESEILGINRFVANTNKNSAGGFRREQVKCAENLSMAEMGKLQIEQQNVTNEYREMIAKNKIKQSNLKKAKEKQQFELQSDAIRQRKFAERKSDQDRKAQQNQGTTIQPIRGAVGNKGQ